MESEPEQFPEQAIELMQTRELQTKAEKMPEPEIEQLPVPTTELVQNTGELQGEAEELPSCLNIDETK